MVTLTWWILKRNCESCKRAASVLQKGCLWSCKRAITLTLPHCALEKGSSSQEVAPHAGHMFLKKLFIFFRFIHSKPTGSC